jgi:D-alanine-D-alanine ligase-like ATP-grasp enzyme
VKRQKPRVAFMAPILERLAPAMGAELLIEPEFGYVGLIKFPNGNRSYFWDNKFNLNSVSAARIAQDKGYAHYFLAHMGYKVPRSLTFFRESFKQRVKSARGIVAARRFAHAIGWPVYLKPLRRSQGDGVTLVTDEREFDSAVRGLFADERALQVQEAVAGGDYRIVVLDGALLSAYERIPLTVVGDGKSSIDQLLKRLQRSFDAQGRDTRIPMRDPRIGDALRRARRRRTSVLPAGTALRLLDVANLSLGGTTRDITERLHPSFARLAARVAADLDLRFAGVDVIAPDATRPLGAYAVLEVNSAPGLDHYATFGPAQDRHVDALYLEVLRAIERGPRPRGGGAPRKQP